MTDKQKSLITEYRREGFGYKKISQLTGMCESTVKTFCRRNSLSRNTNFKASAQDAALCKCCGSPLVQTQGRKRKLFCSDRCRNKWWNAHLDQVNRKAFYEYTCPACGKLFTVYGNANRKYCTHECYIKDRFGGGRDQSGGRAQRDRFSDDNDSGRETARIGVDYQRGVQTI